MKTIIFLAALVFLVLSTAYGIAVYLTATTSLPWASELQQRVGTVCREAWLFGKPLLQLVAIVLILQYCFEKVGFSFRERKLHVLFQDIKTTLAIVVVAAFAVSALAQSEIGMSALKDVALVVVGFYFGRRNPADSEEQRDDGKPPPPSQNPPPKSNSETESERINEDSDAVIVDVSVPKDASVENIGTPNATIPPDTAPGVQTDQGIDAAKGALVGGRRR